MAPRKTKQTSAEQIANEAERIADEAEQKDIQPDQGSERDAPENLPNPCVYCGPSVRGVTRQYTTYQGGIGDALRAFLKEHPDARGLIVPTGEFSAMRKRLETHGTPEAKLYKAVKERLGSPRKPSEAGFVGEGGAR